MKWLVGLLAVSLGASEYPKPDVREEQQVEVDGVTETWQLLWTSALHHSECSDHAMAITCPCQGFGYSEAGDLDVVRFRAGAEVERLHVKPYFREWSGNDVVVQRWALLDSDTDEIPQSTIAKRPTVQVMNFGDYDHDGGRTEFYFQTASVPCGKSYGVVIGVSKQNPHLHAFGTASKPNDPLYLQKREWEALRNASEAVTTLDWQCGDHGSETEKTLLLGWSAAGISGTMREYDCPGGAKNGKLVKQSELPVQ